MSELFQRMTWRPKLTVKERVEAPSWYQGFRTGLVTGVVATLASLLILTVLAVGGWFT